MHTLLIQKMVKRRRRKFMFLYFTARNKKKKKRWSHKISSVLNKWPKNVLCMHLQSVVLPSRGIVKGMRNGLTGTSQNSTQRDAKFCTWGGTTQRPPHLGAWEWVLYQMIYRGHFQPQPFCNSMVFQYTALCKSYANKITISLFSLQNSKWLLSG